MYTSSASNSLASRARATFINKGLHTMQSHPTNCGLVWQHYILPIHSKSKCFLDESHSKWNFHVTKDSIEICDI